MSILKTYNHQTNGWREEILYFGEVLCRFVLFSTKKSYAGLVVLKDVVY